VEQLGLSAVELHAPNRPTLFETLFAFVALKSVHAVESLTPEKIIENIQALFSRISFEEVSSSANIPVPSAHFAAWGDYDADGFLDLLTEKSLFRNNGDGTFTDVTEDSKLSGKLADVSGFADLDNDGCQDIIELQADAIYLYRNDCRGMFSPYGFFYGKPLGKETMGFAFSDYDNDGDLDIYTVGYYMPVNPYSDPTLDTQQQQPNILWRNEGYGFFRDVTDTAGVTGFAKCSDPVLNKLTIAKSKASFQPIWFDYDNDYDSDLFIATDAWVSPLYRNNGDGTFTDVTEEAGLCVHGTGMGVAVADIDTNGYLDVYVTNVGANYLWMNQGDGTFVESAFERNATDLEQGWGTHFTDFDNDGDADLYAVNGSFAALTLPAAGPKIDSIDFGNLDMLFENNGSGFFNDVTHHAGIFGPYFKQASASADYDNDGKVDLYVTASGHPPDVFNSLYHNTSKTSNHWISLRLKGVQSNKDGIGATVLVSAGSIETRSQVIRGSSFFGQDTPWLHFGLGNKKTVDSIVVHWPSGIQQTLRDVPADQVLTLTEPEQ
jgi:enediyne biosynthesis protein E4